MYKIYKDTKGEYRWNYVSQNGNIIADSGEGYRNKADCENGIRIMKNSANANTDDQS